MRTLKEIVRDARRENPGAAVACTRRELLHVLTEKQPTHEAWAKLLGDVQAVVEDIVVLSREELLEAIDAEFDRKADAARVAAEQKAAEEAAAEESRVAAEKQAAADAAAAEEQKTEAEVPSTPAPVEAEAEPPVAENPETQIE